MTSFELVLRSLGDSSIPELFRVLNDTETYRFLPAEHPVSEARLAEKLEADAHPGGETFTLHLMDASQALIGIARYRPEGANRFEIGYMLSSKWWRKGLATRTIGKLLDELSRRYGSFEAVATVDIDNIGSIRALEKHGFLYCGRRESMLKMRASFDLMYARTVTGSRLDPPRVDG